jgi:dynein heavy chain
MKGAIPAKNALVVTDGTKEAFQGTGCYFIRTSTKAITTQNVFADVTFGFLGNNVLASLTTVVKNVILPSLKAQVSFRDHCLYINDIF